MGSIRVCLSLEILKNQRSRTKKMWVNQYAKPPLTDRKQGQFHTASLSNDTNRKRPNRVSNFVPNEDTTKGRDTVVLLEQQAQDGSQEGTQSVETRAVNFSENTIQTTAVFGDSYLSPPFPKSGAPANT